MKRALVLAAALIVLLPATAAIAFVVFLDAPAWPQRQFTWPQAIFDASLVLLALGLTFAWRRCLRYLRRRRTRAARA